MPALAEFVNSTFDEFALLNQEEKWVVFQSFILMMWTMDTIYRTYRLVPPDLYSSMNVITETTFMDSNNMMDFFVDAPASKLNREDLAKMMKECIADRTRLNILNMMNSLEITEIEYSALLALGLWNPNIKNATETIEKVAKEARSRIFHDMHLLYKMDGREDYSLRFGELLILHGAFQVSCCKFREDIELFNLFDLFLEDTFLYDMWYYAFLRGAARTINYMGASTLRLYYDTHCVVNTQ